MTASGIGLGSFLIPPLAQAVIVSGGWREGYLVLGLILLLIPLPLAALFR